MKRKRCFYIMKIRQLLAFREISTLYSKSHMKPVSTLFEQNVELLMLKHVMHNHCDCTEYINATGHFIY
jgi:hypothetical protein